MTFKTLFRIGLIFTMIFQMILALNAEHAEDYVRASYEMLWVFFLLYLCHNEFEK